MKSRREGPININMLSDRLEKLEIINNTLKTALEQSNKNVFEMQEEVKQSELLINTMKEEFKVGERKPCGICESQGKYNRYHPTELEQTWWS